MRQKWPGFNSYGNVIIELAMDTVCLARTRIDVYGDVYAPKQELHVTVIGSTLGQQIQNKLRQLEYSHELLEKTFEEIDWSYSQSGPVHILSRAVNGVTEKSIILLIDMPGMTMFYDELKKLGLLDAATPVPPAHITLYTRNCPLGIGVPNNKVLGSLSVKKLLIDELNKLCE